MPDIERLPELLVVNDFDFSGQFVRIPEQILKAFCGLFRLLRSGDWDCSGFHSVRQLAEGLTCQRVEHRRGTGGVVGKEFFQVRTNLVQIDEYGRQLRAFGVSKIRHCLHLLEILLCVCGQTLVAEALPAGGGQDNDGGAGCLLCFFAYQPYKTLANEEVDSVLVLPSGDGVGLLEEVRVTEAAGDQGGGGRVFLFANQIHFFIGEAVETDQHPCGAAEGGESSRIDLACDQIVHAFGQYFDRASQAVGHAFVGPGGSRRRLSAARAPRPHFISGGVGDAVAVEFRLSESLAGLSIFSEGFARFSGQCFLLWSGRQGCSTMAPGFAAGTACCGKT